jgi:phytoene dehydrogenase-like protein
MDRAANVAAFNALAPGDGERHAADVGGVEADAPFLFALLGGRSGPGRRRGCGGQVASGGLRGLAAWFGQALTPARGWLETGYQSPRCRRFTRPGCCTPA